MPEQISISEGNMKLGRVANISLPPIVTCRTDAPCTEDCYAMKSYRMYPPVQQAWDRNWRIYQASPQEYERQLLDHLRKWQPKYFRWHVGGDVPDGYYMEVIRYLATTYERTAFLLYTKRYDMAAEILCPLPPNLSVVLSMWPGLPVPNSALPKAWLNAPGVTLPEEYFKCKGSCSDCHACWQLAKLGVDVVFDKH